MPSEQQVSARVVLDAVLEIKRIGQARALERLEEDEPELASYLMESLTDVHQQLLSLGGRAKQSQRVYRDIQALVLTCIAAMRRCRDSQSEAGA